MNNIILQIEKIGLLKREWDELLEKSPVTSVFLTWNWMSEWCSRLLRPYEEPCLVTARHLGQLVGIAPLMLSKKEGSEKTIGFIGQSYSYGLGFIVDPAFGSLVYDEFIRFLMSQISDNETIINLIHVSDDPLFIPAIQTSAVKNGYLIQRGYQDPSRAIPLDGSFENYLKQGVRSKKLRNKLPLLLQGLESEAKVRFYRSSPASFDQFWTELLTFHRETMIRRNRDSVLMGDEFPAQLASFVRQWPEPVDLRLFNLDLDGAPAVRLLGILHRSVFFGLTIGLNPVVRERFSRYNLAILAQLYCIRSVVEDQCIAYDFLGGSPKYKSAMGGREHSGISLEIRKKYHGDTAQKRNIALITNSFLRNSDDGSLQLGGIEVWLRSFTRVLIRSGLQPVIFQSSSNAFRQWFEGAEVVAFNGRDRHAVNRQIHEEIGKRGITLVVYASSFVGENHFIPGSIFIQHGIHWDYSTGNMGFTDRIRWKRIQRKLARHDVKMARASKMTIAVDTQFINYYRTVANDSDWAGKIRYIPNFATPQEKVLWRNKWQNTGKIHLAFTRRFELRRGVVQFAEALEILLEKCPELEVTLAGGGLYKPWLEEKFGRHKNIRICELSHQEIYQLLNTVHIAVIPSTYSEGTSLACLEAMASGCAVIATTTGGLANLVIPGFNGMLVQPEATHISRAVLELTGNPDRMKKMAQNGYSMVVESFTEKIWEERIREALVDKGILH